MSNLRYINQTGPFWDFVASMEEQGASHPLFANRGGATEGNNDERPNPWTEGWGAFPFGSMPHRGRHGPGHHHHQHGPAPPTSDEEMPQAPAENEKEAEAGPSEARGPAPTEGENPCGAGGRRGRWGGRGRGGPWARGRGGFGGRGGFPMHHLAQMFQSQFAGADGNKDEDFSPEVDVFDTPEAFVIHVSLPGAKKEDVGVNWDAEKSELSLAGVIHRPGDEEFLKTLAMDERKVGAFERKVRLGSRANPAQVDVDGISARMEDGVLRVEVPKLDSGYVEIKKVDVE